MFEAIPQRRPATAASSQPLSKLRDNVVAADKAGLGIAIHAIGDEGNAELLDIFDHTIKKNGPRDRRFRIEHAQHLRPQDYKRFADLGVIASMQPFHIIDDGRWAEGRIGKKRCESSYALRSLLDAGAKVAFGSDWSVAPLNPLLGIDAAVNRRTLDGKHPKGWFPRAKDHGRRSLQMLHAHECLCSVSGERPRLLSKQASSPILSLSRDILAASEARPNCADRSAHDRGRRSRGFIGSRSAAIEIQHVMWYATFQEFAMPAHVTVSPLDIALVSQFRFRSRTIQEPSRVSFDENGKLEDAKGWAAIKKELKDRKPAHVFLIAHGWRNSKERADDVFTYFGKDLRDLQSKDAPIEVIGFRWPSLLGENDSAADQSFKVLAKAVAGAIANSPNAQKRIENLKEFLKKKSTRLLALSLKHPLPNDDEIDVLVDNLQEPENVQNLLTALTYYQMKKRAGAVGAAGMQECLTQLQESMPETRFHLVGHSFGCKVILSCLASEGRAEKQVDSVTLLQAAVSMHCFAPKIADLMDAEGAYIHAPKRVRGCIAVTFTKNDKALSVAYPAASQAAGQVGELPLRKHQWAPSLFGALGGKGIAGVAGITPIEMGEKGTKYSLRPGFNALDADKIILVAFRHSQGRGDLADLVRGDTFLIKRRLVATSCSRIPLRGLRLPLQPQKFDQAWSHPRSCRY